MNNILLQANFMSLGMIIGFIVLQVIEFINKIKK